MRYVIATLLFCLAGIFSLPLSAQTSTSADSTSVTGHDIVKVAMNSGFTTYVFKKENIQLTRSSRSQFTEGVEVSSCTDLQKGDLVFFGGSRSSSTSIGHVGIVTDVNPSTGTFSFIHASRTGIRISSSDEPYYAKRYVGARRILLS